MTSQRASGFVFVLLLVIVLDCVAREPIKSPPPLVHKTIVRARGLGIPFEGTPGKLDAITDVPGVEVGYTTLIAAKANLRSGRGLCARVLLPSCLAARVLSMIRCTPASSA